MAKSTPVGARLSRRPPDTMLEACGQNHRLHDGRVVQRQMLRPAGASRRRRCWKSRYTHPEKDLPVLLDQFKLTVPGQRPPGITSATKA